MIDQVAYSLGIVAGSIAMCMAVYMQLVSPKYFKPELVGLFWLFGVAVMLINIQAVTQVDNGVIVIQAAMYTLLIVAETYVATKLFKKKSDPAYEVVT